MIPDLQTTMIGFSLSLVVATLTIMVASKIESLFTEKKSHG